MKQVKVLILLLVSIMAFTQLYVTKRFFNDKFFPYINCQCPLQIFYGGASSGKSGFAAQRRIISMVQEQRNYLIVRKISDTLRSSIFAETEWAINALKLNEKFSVVPSLMEIVYRPDGRKILFRGLDNVEKLKSIRVKNGTITDLEIEEATEISEDDYDKLTLRMRGKSNCTKRKCLYFNPTFKTSWLARKFFNGQWIKYKYDGNILIVHSTHLDNKFLDEQDHKDIESKTGYLRDVYALGKWGVLGDLIFTNWSIEDCKDLNFDITRYGLDFGFTNDPSTILKVGIDLPRKTLFIQGEVYGYGMVNDVLAVKSKPLVNGNPVWCDNAEPKSIRELHQQGENSINAQATIKGKDSVWHSLQWLQQWKIIVDKNCPETINELSQYQWKKNKDGISLNEPVEINDHCIAALRYATERDRLGALVAISV